MVSFLSFKASFIVPFPRCQDCLCSVPNLFNAIKHLAIMCPQYSLVTFKLLFSHFYFFVCFGAYTKVSPTQSPSPAPRLASISTSRVTGGVSHQAYLSRLSCLSHHSVYNQGLYCIQSYRVLHHSDRLSSPGFGEGKAMVHALKHTYQVSNQGIVLGYQV